MRHSWKHILSLLLAAAMLFALACPGLAAGDKFNVYKKGRKVKNPQTGMEIELPGTLIGVVTVQLCMGDTPETEISFCSYNGDDIDEEHLDNYYILDE